MSGMSLKELHDATYYIHKGFPRGAGGWAWWCFSNGFWLIFKCVQSLCMASGCEGWTPGGKGGTGFEMMEG